MKAIIGVIGISMLLLTFAAFMPDETKGNVVVAGLMGLMLALLLFTFRSKP